MAEISTWPGWECVRQLGAGSFGKVYEIQKVENEKVYKAALKVITIPQNDADIENIYSEGMDESGVTEYFKGFVDDVTNEFALMADLKGYTNIVSYEDHMIIKHENKIGWDILIRMELLTPLLEWEKAHPMNEDDIIRLGCDMCRALELCHKNKIIHRDIKPQNIFVNKNGDFKLGDFGIARVVEKTSSAMSQKGTYTYMAPEVFRGQYYNETADLYSLGIVLYRCLNQNRTPFLPSGNMNFNDRQMAQERRMAGETIPAPLNGSEKLKQAILMTLQYNPANRVQSAGVLRTILEQCKTTERVHYQDSPVRPKVESQVDMDATAPVRPKVEPQMDMDATAPVRSKMEPQADTEKTTPFRLGSEYDATTRVNTEQTPIRPDVGKMNGKSKMWIAGVVVAVLVFLVVLGSVVEKKAQQEVASRPAISDQQVSEEETPKADPEEEDKAEPETAVVPEEEVTLKVAAVETAYGAEMWEDVCEAFTAETGIEVELTVDRNIETIIWSRLENEKSPDADVIHCALGREEVLTESFLASDAVEDITDVLSMRIPGENTLVSQKILGGFTETYLTNPYGDGRTYLAPMFYAPCGLFYNADLLREKGWEVPETWDEMWELGDKALREGIYLFTYPTTGYLDAFLYSVIYSCGGADAFMDAMNYESSFWNSRQGEQCLEIIAKMAEYTHPLTVSQANDSDYWKNQQLVLNNEAIFMPNGIWVVDEMEGVSRASGFEWGMTALPAVDSRSAGYSYAWMEEAWIPSTAENIDEAKEFIAFLYSDEAAVIFAKSGAIQPVYGIGEKLSGEDEMFYTVFDDGAKAAMGNFPSHDAVYGTIRENILDPINDLAAGNITADEYKRDVLEFIDKIN